MISYPLASKPLKYGIGRLFVGCLAVALALGILSPCQVFAQGWGACTSNAVLDECPSFCRDRCRNDREFKLANAAKCVLAISGSSVDSRGCSSQRRNPTSGEADLCVTLDHSDAVWELLCKENDFPTCAESTPALRQWYTEINEKLERSMEVYKPILEGNFDKTEKTAELCAYSFEEVAQAYRLSVQDNESSTELQSEIEAADDCADEIIAWQTNAATANTVAMENLRADSKAQLEKSTEDLTKAKTELKQSIAKITSAVPTLKFLLRLHYRTCPRIPSIERR